MADSSSSKLSLFIGKPVRDSYGFQIGWIASFVVNPSGRIDGVFIQHKDGEFARYPSDQFRIDGDDVVFLPLVKLRVKALCSEIPLIWRKTQALNELMEKKKVSPEMFDDLHKGFEGALNQLKADAKDVLQDVEKQMVKCTQQIKELNSAFIHLQIEREIGRINDQSYQTAMEMMQRGLKRANTEKSDLEAMKNSLSNMLLGEKKQAVTQAEEEKRKVPASPPSTLPEPPALPEPPVVRVKGVNKPNP